MICNKLNLKNTRKSCTKHLLMDEVSVKTIIFCIQQNKMVFTDEKILISMVDYHFFRLLYHVRKSSHQKQNKLVFVSSIIWFSHAKTKKNISFNSFPVKNEKNEAFHFLCFYAFLT